MFRNPTIGKLSFGFHHLFCGACIHERWRVRQRLEGLSLVIVIVAKTFIAGLQPNVKTKRRPPILPTPLPCRPADVNSKGPLSPLVQMKMPRPVRSEV